jgi:DNA polymerase-1
MRAKELVTIIKDVPIKFDPKALELEEPDFDKIEKLFDILEFRTLASRILADHGQVKTESSPSAAPVHIQGDLFSSLPQPVEIETKSTCVP